MKSAVTPWGKGSEASIKSSGSTRTRRLWPSARASLTHHLFTLTEEGFQTLLDDVLPSP